MSKVLLRSLVTDIRSVYPDIFIIVGGPFVYSSYLLLQKIKSNPEYLLASEKKDYLFLEIDQEPDVDLYIVSLRGENILLEVLNDLRNDSSINLPHNSAKLSGGSYIFSNRMDDVSNAEPMHIDWNSMPDMVFQNGIVPMQASNGCPNKCLFCNYMKDPRIMHITPLDRIIEDMKVVARRGARYVWFVDDNFRLGKNDLNDVCKRMIAEKINLRWMSFMRASTLVRTDPILLKQAGCVEVQLGLESGDRHILQLMNKQADPDMYASVIEKLMRHGINCSCYFLFGYPGETDASAGRTIEFIKSIEFPNYDGVLTWSLFPFMLLPLSPIYEIDHRQQFSLKGHWQKS